MRNEYTDYIAHGHKYFAVIDLGKKNSKGTKLRRYFYSANEYKAYLQGKKTTDDKLLGAASKVASKLSGVKAIGKGLASTAKAIRNTNKEVRALKKSGFDDDSARAEIRGRSAYQHMKKAGLEVTNNDGEQLEGKDKKGNKYRMDIDNRMIRKAVHQTDPDHWKDQSKKLIGEQKQKENAAKEAKRVEQNKANLKAHPEKSILNNPIREHLVERLVEKGITKAKAEKLRDTIKSTVGNATALANAADKINNKLGGIQDALLSGDSEKLYNEMNDLMENAEENQKEMEQIYKSIPIFGTFLEAAEKQNEKFDAEWQKEADASNKEYEDRWNKISGEKGIDRNDMKSRLETASKAWNDVNSSTNDVSVIADSAKKTIDAALAGPKTVSEEAKSIIEDSEDINKRYEELKKKMNRK